MGPKLPVSPGEPRTKFICVSPLFLASAFADLPRCWFRCVVHVNIRRTNKALALQLDMKKHMYIERGSCALARQDDQSPSLASPHAGQSWGK